MTTELVRDSDGTEYWIAEYRELLGCKTDGMTEAEAVENLQGLFDEYIQARIDEKLEIQEPEPRSALEQEVFWVRSPRPIQFPGLSGVNAEGTDETAAKVEPETRSAIYDDIAA